MSLSKEAEQVLAETVSGWFSSFEGISAIDVAREIKKSRGQKKSQSSNQGVKAIKGSGL